MTWKNGRELATAGNGTHSVSYDYDVSGLRTYKIVDGVRHDYTYASGLLLRESYTQNGTTYTLDFVYDQSNRPYILNLTTTTGSTTNTTACYYLLNLQGDVLRLVNENGVTVASYDYDPYGNILTSTGTLANLNPLRYRGYYYDPETGFYYLQSRYYDPAIGRFINADTYSSTGQDFLGYNMFAYCGNNPIIRCDNNGEFWNFIIGAVVGAVVSAVSTAIDSYMSTGSVDWGSVAISAATGAVEGAVAASGLGAVAQAGITAATSFVGTLATDVRTQVKENGWDNVSLGSAFGKAAVSAGTSFCTSIAGTAIGKASFGSLESTGEKLVLRGTKRGMSIYTKRQLSQFVTKGKRLINTARGLTSVLGTIATWPINTAVSTSMS